MRDTSKPAGEVAREAVLDALQSASRASDHHAYYRSLNRMAGVMAAIAISGLDVHPGVAIGDLAERVVSRAESELGADLAGYGGRPLFPALRKRVAETLAELGY